MLLYVQQGATANSNCSTPQMPCSSIQAALGIYEEAQTIEPLTIQIFSGVYDGIYNIQQMLPSTPIVIQAVSLPVQIDCQNYYEYAFKAYDTLEISEIEIIGCTKYGIYFEQSSPSNTLKISSTTIKQITGTGIYADSSKLQVTNCIFDENTNGIKVYSNYSNDKTYTITNSEFTYGNIEIIANENGDTTIELSENRLVNISSNCAICIANGVNTVITKTNFTNVDVAINYQSNKLYSDLLIQNFTINSSKNGIQIQNSTTNVEIQYGFIMNTLNNGISLDHLNSQINISSINLNTVCFNNTNSCSGIEIKNSNEIVTLSNIELTNVAIIENSDIKDNNIQKHGIYVSNSTNIQFNDINLLNSAVITANSSIVLPFTELYGIRVLNSNSIDIYNLIATNVSKSNNNCKTFGIFSQTNNYFHGKRLTLTNIGGISTDLSTNKNSAFNINSASISIEESSFFQVGDKITQRDEYDENIILSCSTFCSIDHTNIIESSMIQIYSDLNFGTSEISSCSFKNSYSALYIEGSSAIINNTNIYNCGMSAPFITGGIQPNITNQLIIDNSQFIENISYAISLFTKLSVLIQNSGFTNNYGTLGSAIYGESYSSLQIESCDFYGNKISGNNNAPIYINSPKTIQTYFKDTVMTVPENSYGIRCSSPSTLVLNPNYLIFSNVQFNSTKNETYGCNIKYGTSKTTYLNPTILANENVDCSQISPCASIQDITSKYGDYYDYIGIIITNVADHYNYTTGENQTLLLNTSENVNITFSTSIIIGIHSQNKTIIDCVDFDFCFYSAHDLSIFSLSETNSIEILYNDNGIIFHGDQFYLSNTQFQFIPKTKNKKQQNQQSNSILFIGNSISLNNCNFKNIENGIIIENVILNLNFNELTFENSTYKPININSTNSNISKLSLNNINLTNTGGIYLSIPEKQEAFLSKVKFHSKINSNYAISIYNGNWTLSNIEINDCDNSGIFYDGNENQMLTIDILSLHCKENGISFNSLNSFFSLSSGDFYDIENSYGIFILNSSHVDISFCNFTNVYVPLHVTSYFASIFVSDSFFISSGENYIFSYSHYASSFHNLAFENSNGFSMISNCNWTISNVKIQNSNHLNDDLSFFDLIGCNSCGFSFSSVIFNDLPEISYGTAIKNFNSSLEFNDITMNNVSSLYGAIYNENGNIKIDNSYFSNCKSLNGSILYSTNANEISISLSTFSNNIASYNGGAIYLLGSNLDISNCTFSLNSAQLGGSIYAYNLDSASFLESFFNNNTADIFGGGIYLDSSNTTFSALVSSSFIDNNALNGAAISCCGNSSSCSVSVTNEDFNLETNVNVQDSGSDIACLIVATNYDDINSNGDDSGGSVGMIILYVFLGVFGLICFALIITVPIFILYRRKQKLKNNNGYAPLVNESD